MGGALPVLSDDRVVLRASEPRDLPAVDAGIHDPDVIRWIGPQKLTAPEVLARNEQWWAAEGIPTLSICELDGTCVGLVWVGYRDDDRSTGFVGYWLLPAARGRGMATSAVRLISGWAIRELPITKLRLTTAQENERSQRVAERSGFRRVSSAAGESPAESPAGSESPQVVFEFDRSEPPRDG